MKTPCCRNCVHAIVTYVQDVEVEGNEYPTAGCMLERWKQPRDFVPLDYSCEHFATEKPVRVGPNFF